MPSGDPTPDPVPPVADGPAAGPAGPDEVGAVLDAVSDRILGPRRYTAEELAAAAGITVDDIEPIWMELGFAPVDRDQPLFTQADLDALELLMAARRHELVSDELAVALARVLGQALARVAATEAQTLVPLVRLLAAHRGGPVPTGDLVPPALTGGAPVASAEELVDTVADVLVPTIERFMTYSWRRHLLAALGRLLRPQATEVVGFADLVGFTRLSAQLDPDDLPDVVGRFQELATQHLVTLGGRVVKAIGDAVLFVFPDGPTAALGALALVRAAGRTTTLPGVRVGLACGSVVELEGDLYGDTVNRAARLVELARPDTVLADDDTALQCLERDDLLVRPLRPRRLKGLGYVKVWAVRGQPEPTDD